MLKKSIIYTRSNSSNTRENMSILDTYITTVNSDIEKFNEYTKTNYEALTVKGERCDDMISNLSKGYLAAVEKSL